MKYYFFWEGEQKNRSLFSNVQQCTISWQQSIQQVYFFYWIPVAWAEQKANRCNNKASSWSEYKRENKTKVVINILVSDNGQMKSSSNIETNKIIYIKDINHGRVNNNFKSNLIVHKRVAQKMTQMHATFFFCPQLHSMTTNKIQRMRSKWRGCRWKMFKCAQHILSSEQT